MAQIPTRNLNPPATSTEWIDISVPIHAGMVHWPGDPPVEINTLTHVERGDICTVSALKLGAHTGTHIDAPIHYLPGGSGTHEVPLHGLIGHARVIEIKDRDTIREAELRQHNLGPSERLLFKTLNSQRCWSSPQFVNQFIAISEDAAAYLAQLKILTVGIDYLSVGSPEVHRILLGAGVVIIEGLNLAEVRPGHYELVCLPLKILGGDGAPARALLKSYAPLG
jgi:arylformamidase